MSDIEKVKQLRQSTGAGFKDCNDDARRSIDLYCNLIRETINNAKSSIPTPEPKKDVARDKNEKTQGKTVQEIDREKLEQKFSKDKKETLN